MPVSRSELDNLSPRTSTAKTRGFLVRALHPENFSAELICQGTLVL